jgi:hypothetical protein
MSMTDINVNEILSIMASKFNSHGIGFIMPDAKRFQTDTIQAGMILLTNGPREEGDKLKHTYAYKDSDGVTVLISVVVSEDNIVKEIELWRGDGKNILKIADPSDFFIPPRDKPF